MGRPLLEQEPVFRATVEQCDNLLKQYTRWSLLEVLLGDETHSHLHSEHIEIIQTALFTIQVALSDLWRSWGIEPDAGVGYSMGEVAAAHVAGILELPDAIRVIVVRSRLLHQGLRLAAQRGAMAWVRLSRKAAEELLIQYKDRVWIAAHNSPGMTVLSGDAIVLEELLRSLKKKRIPYRPMNTLGAGHTPQLEILRKELVRALDGLKPQTAKVPIFSTNTGGAIEGQEFDAQYWGRQLMEPVLFSEAIDSLMEDGYNTFLEISPEPMLASSISHCLRHHGYQGTAFTSLRRNQKDREVMLESLSALFALGAGPIPKFPAVIDTADHRSALPWRHGSVVLEESEHSNGISSHSPPLNDMTRVLRPGTYYRERRVVMDRREGTDRRVGLERRRALSTEKVIELRSGVNRRSGIERRSGKERRVALG